MLVRSHVFIRILYAVLSGSLLVASLMRLAAPLALAMPQPIAAQAALSDLEPLPGSCGGGLPPSGGVVCCVSGYVMLDGQPVSGARVTISTTTAPVLSVVTSTAPGPDSALPYYHADLSTMLNLQPGATIVIKAEFSVHTREITHQVLAGGQNIDLVLAHALTPEDYRYTRELSRLGSPGELSSPSGVAVDPAGTIYVSDLQNARIQVFNRNGQFLRQWGSLGFRDGQMAEPFHIALDSHSNVYVADINRVHKFSSTGALLKSWGNRPDSAPENIFQGISSLTVDTNDTVYAVMQGASGLYGIRRLNSSNVWTTVREPLVNGAGTNTRPQGIAVDQVGNIYVADTETNSIQKFSSSGVFLDEWGRAGGSVGTGAGEFNAPRGLAADKNGNIYVTELGNQRIQKLTITSNTWSTIASGAGSQIGQFSSPNAIALDQGGNMYVADTINNRIQKITPNGSAQNMTPESRPILGQLVGPRGIAIDSVHGFVYVTDASNSLVTKFTIAGVPVLKWGEPGIGNGQFGFVEGIAVDSDGNVYVSDTGPSHDRIQKFNSAGAFLATWRGNGSTQLNDPQGIAIDTSTVSNMLYIADRGSNRIMKYTTSGDLQWVRTGAEPGGPGAFNRPRDVEVAPDGTLYIADQQNNRIVKMTANGDLIAVWTDAQLVGVQGLAVDSTGNVYATSPHLTQKYTSTGIVLARWGTYGPGEGAFSGPAGVAVNPDGDVYVVDDGNSRVQVFRSMVSNQPPVATIVQMRVGDEIAPQTVQPSAIVQLRGRGGSDRTTSQQLSYEWQLDGATFPNADTPNPFLTMPITEGPHTIRLRVHDSATGASDWQTRTVTVAAPRATESWTMLLYLDGDNNGTSTLRSKLRELEESFGSYPRASVKVVALYDGPQNGDSVFAYQEGDQFIREERGEVNMGDPETLVQFVQQGKLKAPAAHYYLAIADHANGIDGIAWDETSQPTDYITNAELRRALERITDSGAHPIDVLHFDGCLMGMVENAYQMRGMARYLVSSENLAWSAFSYVEYRQSLYNTTTPKQLAELIATTYHEQVRSYPHTISVFDLSVIDVIAANISTLGEELRRYAHVSETNRNLLTTIRSQVQKFDSDGDLEIEQSDTYVDLDHLAELIINQVSDSGVQAAASALRVSLRTTAQSLVLKEYQESGSTSGKTVTLDQARGVAIYYPDRPTATTQDAYTNGELEFVGATSWDTFLAAGLDPLAPDQTVYTANLVEPLPFFRMFLPLIQK